MSLLSTEKRIEVLNHLVEGTGIRSTAELTGTSKDTAWRLASGLWGAGSPALIDSGISMYGVAHGEREARDDLRRSLAKILESGRAPEPDYCNRCGRRMDVPGPMKKCPGVRP